MITYHPAGTNVRLRFLLVDGGGVGLVAQNPVVAIKRRSDGLYWTGAAWQAGFATLAMTQEDAANLSGSYYLDFDQAAGGGGSEEYLVRYRNPAAAPNTSLDEEQIVFRPFASSLSPERRLMGALADDGSTFKVALWIEEGGLRVNDYSQLAAQVKDPAGALVASLGTDTTDTGDGVFYFEIPIAALQRNTPYVVTVQATRGFVTDLFNYGVVRV